MDSGFRACLTVAVVGAEGFLGKRLCHALRRKGAVVIPFTRSRPIEIGDVEAPDAREADVVYYLASSVTPGAAEAYPERAAEDHDALARALRGMARSDRRRPTFVLASSSTSYDPSSSPPYSEDDPLKSETVHGEVKLRMEDTLLSFQDSVRPIILRLASMYGPGHPTKPGHGVIAHWLRCVTENRSIDVIGDEDIRRDFIYIDDVVDAMIRVSLARTEEMPMILNIGSGAPTSLGELLREITTATNSQPHVVRHPSRSFDRRELWLNIDRAKSTLGWAPVTPLSEGLRRTWESIRQPDSAASNDQPGAGNRSTG